MTNERINLVLPRTQPTIPRRYGNDLSTDSMPLQRYDITLSQLNDVIKTMLKSSREYISPDITPLSDWHTIFCAQTGLLNGNETVFVHAPREKNDIFFSNVTKEKIDKLFRGYNSYHCYGDNGVLKAVLHDFREEVGLVNRNLAFVSNDLDSRIEGSKPIGNLLDVCREIGIREIGIL